jgi:hypothetical protein
MKKQTTQSRATARRKARQQRAWGLFRGIGIKNNWPLPAAGRLPFGQLNAQQKFAVMRWYREIRA